jgi:hypothetical protein
MVAQFVIMVLTYVEPIDRKEAHPTHWIIVVLDHLTTSTKSHPI